MPTFDLPWPPSTNRYWRKWQNRMVMGKDGRDYRDKVKAGMVIHRTLYGRLSVRVEAYPPDRRTRDLDNVLKALLDAMEHAGAYHNDSQIDRITIERKEVETPGRVRVTYWDETCVDHFGGEK